MRRVVAFILAVCCSAPVFAEPPPAEGQSDSNSFLQQLNQEVRTACRRANEGLVRVQVPAELANPAVDVIRKWEPRLNPERRRSKPTGDASTTAPVNSDAARPVPGIDLEPHVVTVGLVIDEKGTLLVPAYLDPARVDRPFIIITGGGITSEATMLAADKSTGVTLLRMRESTTTCRLSCSSRPHSRSGPRSARKPSAATTR